MIRACLAVAIFAVVGTSPATGQNGTGFWFGGGLGIGSARLTCQVCDGPLAARRTVTTLQARLGGTLSPALAFGVEANGWRKTDQDEDVRQTFVGVGGVLYWYPNPAGARYYVKAGFGPVFYRADEVNVGSDEETDPAVTSTAFGGHFGVGYDLLVGANVSITPFFNFTGTLYGNLRQENTTLVGANPTLVQLGIGMTWR